MLRFGEQPPLEMIEEERGMPRFLFRWLWTGLPVFCGYFLSSIVWADGQRYVSLFWSLVFGLSECWFFWFPYKIEHPFPYDVIFALGGPALVAIFLAWISGIVWDNLREPGRWIAIGVLVFLCSPIVTLERAQQPPISSWPIYDNVSWW
jgi:hypothetical protein